MTSPTVKLTLEPEKEIRTYPSERVEKLGLLPYHSLGVAKYEMLGMKYNLTIDIEIIYQL